MNVGDYIDNVFVKGDPDYAKITKAIKEIGMPTISVSPATGKLLTLLVKMTNAERILEVGALGGYSGICLLRGAGKRGQLTSLELAQAYADTAKQHIEDAGFNGQVAYKIGPALSSFDELLEKEDAFDFFFIDADKENYTNYLDRCIQLSKPGSIIVGDNTLWSGKVLDAKATDAETEALRAFNKTIADHPKLESLLLPIGDGVTVARVKE